MVLGEIWRMGANFEEKKMLKSPMATQNESMQEVSSKSDNENMFKNRGKIIGGMGEIRGRGENLEEKN